MYSIRIFSAVINIVAKLAQKRVPEPKICHKFSFLFCSSGRGSKESGAKKVIFSGPSTKTNRRRLGSISMTYRPRRRRFFTVRKIPCRKRCCEASKRGTFYPSTRKKIQFATLTYEKRYFPIRGKKMFRPEIILSLVSVLKMYVQETPLIIFSYARM